MSFLTNIVDFFSSSNKTHDQLNSFVNEKFTFFLNNSNLLLTFVSDFEDYKSGDPNIPIGKSKCNECEDLYILTSDIFEKYFNRINIPYDIDVSEGNSKTNYKNKVLYFFDLKDLKKILDEHNLEKSSSDIGQLNKKRLLCKIISLSFIKLYIIVKSIYQTFNIYDSLIIEEKTEAPVIEPLPPIDPTIDPTLDPTIHPTLDPTLDPTLEPAIHPVQEPAQEPLQEPLQEPALDPVQEPPLDPFQEPPLDPTIHPVQEPAGDPYGIPDPFHDHYKTPEPIQTQDHYRRALPPIQTQDHYRRALPPIQTHGHYGRAVPLPPIEQNNNADTQSGGNVFYNMYNTLLGKKTESPIVTTNNVASGLSPASPSITGLSTETRLSPETNPDLSKEKEKEKLQLSNNIFYSIFVILFEDSKDEQLDPTNFNVSFLTKGVSNMTNTTLGAKIPEILQHISNSKIFELDFLGESCLIFRDDNFKFIQLETSDTESKEATMFIDEVDKQHEPFNKIIETKRKLLGTILNKENRDAIVHYYKSESQHKFANFKFFNAFKSHLKTMTKNYFDSRANLYNNIVKELFMFDKKTGAIISLNSNLTYKYISELSKKTEIILLDLHITLFKTLNSILTDSVNEINVMKKKARLSAPVTTQETAPVTTQETAPVTAPVTTQNEANIGVLQHLGGAKTIKHNKRNNKRSIKRNNKRSIKKNRKKRQTRKAKKQ